MLLKTNYFLKIAIFFFYTLELFLGDNYLFPVNLEEIIIPNEPENSPLDIWNIGYNMPFVIIVLSNHSTLGK